MFDKETSAISSDNFWYVMPHERHLFQKKHGASKLLYLFLFKWFENYANFPDIEYIPKNLLAKEEYRALTALFYLHINPYGTFELDLSKRLTISKLGEIA